LIRSDRTASRMPATIELLSGNCCGNAAQGGHRTQYEPDRHPRSTNGKKIEAQVPNNATVIQSWMSLNFTPGDPDCCLAIALLQR
jgi:hypothetical protein